MKHKKSKLELAQEETKKIISKTNKKIEILGNESAELSSSIEYLQGLFDQIRNVPSSHAPILEETKKIRSNWIEQAKKIENDFNQASIKQVGAGVVGVGAGVATVALAPTAAMGIATTFGVASTGTAISALSGAAATNAALAWLGGGALVAGGGGMAVGEAVLALTGPIGWGIAGIAIMTSGLTYIYGRLSKKRIENIFISISERDIKSYKLAIIELDERIIRIQNETKMLNQATLDIKNYGLDYEKMSERQQYELGSYVNLMYSSVQLLIEPIIGLKPKYTSSELNNFISNNDKYKNFYNHYRDLYIFLCNLLYGIHLNDKDMKLFWKALKKNKNILEQFKITKKSFTFNSFCYVKNLLNYEYNNH